MDRTFTAMNGINRFLSRRDKSGEPRRRGKSSDGRKDHKKLRALSGDLKSLLKTEITPKTEKEDIKYEQKKISTLRKRLEDARITSFTDAEIEYGLHTRYASGDVDRAFEIIMLFQESSEGVVKPYNPEIRMYGAENRNAVTCYLDSILFAMFARLGSFEHILHNKFTDDPRRRLSTMIRLWVNMLRTGKLIHSDITKVLQDTLAECGWEDAAEIRQQDTSEAFSFLTEKLELPLLTLKMDIYHTGAEVADDDHKIIHERLLEVAVPPDPGDGKVIQLEDCLEEYFNNRIEVVRRLERSNTITSKRSHSPNEEQTILPHLELAESSSLPASPILQSPTLESPITLDSPPYLRRRAQSIIRHRVVNDVPKDAGSRIQPVRKGSLRKEVLMPAWQFFSLIPWYTEKVPTSDAQVAAHFSSTRPVLGICLKRYSMSDDGRPQRRDTFIDIPLQIALPHFIQDDKEDGPLFGNFKLVLQSIVCHRGNSVHAGHYVSFVRSPVQSYADDAEDSRRGSTDSGLPRYSEDKWIKFDDLGVPRVNYVDIDRALKTEMPYLLFYQVQPMLEISPQTTANEPDPPAYSSPTIESTPPELQEQLNGKRLSGRSGYFDGALDDSKSRLSGEIDRPRLSLNLPRSATSEPRFSSNTSDFSFHSVSTAPPTPSDDTTSLQGSRTTSRFTLPGTRSRPVSQIGESRIMDTISRLGLRKSKDSFNNKPLDSVSTSSVLLPTIEGDQDTEATPTVAQAPSIGVTGPIEEQPEPVVTETPVPDEGVPPPKKKGKEKEHSHLRRSKGNDSLDRECALM